VIRGTLNQAAAYPDATLASIAEFLSAHRALLYSYLTTVSQGGNARHRQAPISRKSQIT
jgi:hypothetical protein